MALPIGQLHLEHVLHTVLLSCDLQPIYTAVRRICMLSLLGRLNPRLCKVLPTLQLCQYLWQSHVAAYPLSLGYGTGDCLTW